MKEEPNVDLKQEGIKQKDLKHESKTSSSDSQQNYSQHVGDMAERKLKAQRDVTKTVWSGLGMMGLVGWSVAIPTLLGAALGIWLDDVYPQDRSWTLALLVVGLCLGCFNAWHWVAKEEKDIHQDEGNDDAN